MLYAKVKRGRNKEIEVTPHKYADQKYRVRFGKRGNRIEKVDYHQLESYYLRGYMMWMSNRQEGHPPGGFAERSIKERP
jgi:hypothetical protein